MKTFGKAAAILIVMAAVALDQVVKYFVEFGLDMHTKVDLLPFLALYRTHNTGIAFSMFSDVGSLALIAITLGVVALVSWIGSRTDPGRYLSRIGFALIVGGAVGNLIDRVWHGYVIDYVLFHLPNWSFAIFNLADAFITLGAGLVILDELIAWLHARTSDDQPTDG